MSRRFAGPFRVAVLTALLPFLAACGFQPLYASQSYHDLAGVEIDTGRERLDYLVEDALEEEFGAGQSPYRLVVENASREERIGVSAQARTRRYALELTSRYSLVRTGTLVHEGVVSERVYFDAPTEAYGLISARLTAEQQAADALARRMIRDVALAIRRSETGLDGTR